MDREIKRRLKNIIVNIVFLVNATIVWTNYRTIRTEAQTPQSYLNNAYLVFSEVSKGVAMDNVYPSTDEEGMTTDGYTFKVYNNSNKNISYKVNFITEDQNTIDNKYIKYSYNINDGEYSVPQTLEDNKVILNDIDGKKENTYNIKFWIDENAGNEIMNKVFSTKIGVESI